MTICDCDAHAFPPLVDIPPGLSRLPRQIGLFGDFRAALLARVRDHGALRDWRARDREDFGLMLLDWWADVADVIAFYNAEHVQDLYLSSARDDERIRRIVGLIGYRPRPALAAEALITGIVDGSDPVTAPTGSGFIADAADSSPPQEFELEADAVLDPIRNRWTLAPIREPVFDRDNVLIDSGSRNLSEGAWVAFSRNGSYSAQQVLSVEPETALDGASYLRLTLSAPGSLPPNGAALDGISVWSFTQSAPVYSQALVTGSVEFELTLIGLFPQIRVGAIVLVEDSSEENALPSLVRTVVSVGFGDIDLAAGTTGDPIKTAVTTVRLHFFTNIAASAAVLRFGRVRAGKLVAPAKAFLDETDIGLGPALAGRHDGPGEGSTGDLLLKGARDRGVRMAGDVVIDPTGRGSLAPSGAFGGFEGVLRTPVEAFGNVMRITRGKGVEEALGSGQGPGVPFQAFTLAKAPLTYVSDPSATGGRRSSLRVYVDGIEWTEVDSLFLGGPGDRIYTVDLDPAGKATITFGDGRFGMPPPLGANNVIARYRFGAGEPPPKANTIRQIAGPVPKLRRVFNVTDAFGGGAGDRPEDIRFNAPASAATFDRAVSASDFAALARDFGALAAVAATEWVPERLREGVVVVAIFEGEPTPEAVTGLETHLAAKAAETTPIRVVAASPVAGELRLSYAVAADANPADVAVGLEKVLLDPFTGFLSPRKAEIGGPVFRSAILGRAAKVPGVATLLGLSFKCTAMPDRLGLGAHEYLAPTLLLEEIAT
jgi:hypothetical protein